MNNNDIYHYGVLGMKWGVRKEEENAPGTYEKKTMPAKKSIMSKRIAGNAKYGADLYRTKVGEKLPGGVDQYDKVIKKMENGTAILSELNPVVKAMTEVENDELFAEFNAEVQREKEWEKEYNRRPEVIIEKGKKTVEDIYNRSIETTKGYISKGKEAVDGIVNLFKKKK
ncbi:MAG: hypothetical protein NC078_11850 [Ruminococcus sp.]|nr:hypothetical protein [Ruminococcus sp.]